MNILLPKVEPREKFIGFTPTNTRFGEIVNLVEESSNKPKTKFEDRFRLCLPYCLQRGEAYGRPGMSLLLNRYYQPLGIRYRIYDYDDYPKCWWIKTDLLDKIFPRRWLDGERRVKSFVPKVIPSDWSRDTCGWAYDDGWCFNSRRSSDYKRYYERIITPMLSAMGALNLTVGLPDFFELRQHEFSSWSYCGPVRKYC